MRYQVTSRTNPPVSLENAKQHLRVTHSLEDTLIQGLVDSALQWAEEYTGAAFSDLTVEATTDTISDTYYIYKYLPILSVDSIVDADSNAVNYTFTAPNLIEITDDLADDAYPLVITFSTAPVVPAMVLSAMYLKIGDLYDYRTDRYMPYAKDVAVRRVSEDLLYPYKLTEFTP